MRTLSLILFLVLFSFPVFAKDAVDPFATRADFAVDDAARPMITVVPTREEGAAAHSRYERIDLNFYAFRLTPENIQSASAGDLGPLEKRRYEGDTNAYNNSNAKIILTVDTESRQITQVDMALPGYTCTIAWKPEELQKFSQSFTYAPDHIKIKNQNSYSCDMGRTKPVFKWNFDVDAPVITAAKK